MKFVYPPAVFKLYAQKAMGGKFLKSLAAAFIPQLIISAVAVLLVFITPAKDAISLFGSGMFQSSEEQMQYLLEVSVSLMYGLSLINALFSFLNVGGEKVCLDIVRGRETKVSKIFSFYDKWYIALIWPMISFILSVGMDMGLEYMDNIGLNAIFVTIAMYVCQLALIFLNIKTAFLSYTLADTGCTSFKKAFALSFKLTGWKTIGNLFLLYISFFGWFLLVAFTGFAIIYVYPYLKISTAALYNVAINEYSKERAQ